MTGVRITDHQHVRISNEPMGLGEVLAVADGAPVELSEEALDLIARSRTVVDAAIDRGEAIYGVTTGVGHARDQRLSPEVLEAIQPILIEMHMGAMGEPMSTVLVRAGMVTRLNGFARGGAGVSVEVARAVAAMLNNQIHPIIPRSGSVGAGDLGQLAVLGRALLGRGQVEWRGERVAAADALRGAGIEPVTLQPKDALAVISSNALTVGHGISQWRAVDKLAAMADLVAAVSMEAMRANPSIFDPAVAGARASSGQKATSNNLRAALEGSSRVDSATASVQDPISFRVVPQVHGACRDVLAGLATNLGNELNAASDNPMVDIASGRVLSNGNFHPMNVALSAESLNLALAHVGLLSERRCGQMWDSLVTAMGEGFGGEASPGIGNGPPPFLAGMALRYPAATRYTRLRQLAQPISLDVPALDLSVEDHATNAAEVLWVTEEIVGIVQEILAVEVLLAFARLRISPEGNLGTRTAELVDTLAEVLDGLAEGTLPEETHVRVSRALAAHVDGLPG